MKKTYTFILLLFIVNNLFSQNKIKADISIMNFWGWECGPVYYIGGECYRTCVYYILGIPNGSSPRGCNDLPGNNPKID